MSVCGYKRMKVVLLLLRRVLKWIVAMCSVHTTRVGYVPTKWGCWWVPPNSGGHHTDLDSIPKGVYILLGLRPMETLGSCRVPQPRSVVVSWMLPLARTMEKLVGTPASYGVGGCLSRSEEPQETWASSSSGTETFWIRDGREEGLGRKRPGKGP